MREITYKEILENIDCGLVIFFEDDFIQPGTVEINDILHKAIRMDDNPEVRAYISQYYGPLDFDLTDGKPEKSQVDEALSEFITPM